MRNYRAFILWCFVWTTAGLQPLSDCLTVTSETHSRRIMGIIAVHWAGHWHPRKCVRNRPDLPSIVDSTKSVVQTLTDNSGRFSPPKLPVWSWFDIFSQSAQHSPLPSGIWRWWRRLCDSSPLVFLHTYRPGPVQRSPPSPPEAWNTSITGRTSFTSLLK